MNDRILVNYWCNSDYSDGDSFIVEGVKSFGKLDEVLEREEPNYMYADYWNLEKHPEMESEEIRTVSI